MKIKIIRLVIEVLCLAALLGSLVFLAVRWAGLPDTVPTHFNGRGEIDGWGPKRSLIALPIINLVMYLMLTGLNAIALASKGSELPPSAACWFSGIKLAETLLFASITVFSALCRAAPPWFLPATLIGVNVPIVGLVIVAIRYEARRKRNR